MGLRRGHSSHEAPLVGYHSSKGGLAGLWLPNNSPFPDFEIDSRHDNLGTGKLQLMAHLLTGSAPQPSP